MTTKRKPLLTKKSIGKQYVRRDGQISGPLGFDEDRDCYQFVDYSRIASYTPFGLLWEGNEYPADLIRLATAAEIKAGRALPKKKKRTAKRAGRVVKVWAFEHTRRDGKTEIGVEPVRSSAKIMRDCCLAFGDQCGPIFRAEIQCPVWEPKK